MDFLNIDGSENNLNNPSFGQAGENIGSGKDVVVWRLSAKGFRAKITTCVPLPKYYSPSPANYADGISALGNVGFPNPREISNALFHQVGSVPDQRGLSEYIWIWGQFIDHDIDHTLLQTGDGAETINIEIPEGDPVYIAGSMIPVTRSVFNENTGTDTAQGIARSARGNGC